MKINLPFLLAFIFFSISLFAQQKSTNFFIPSEIQRAYTSGTRSMDGNPGSGYWQNHAAYDIQVKINPEDSTLSGVEKIVYTNNSPNSLPQLVVSLIQDVLKPGNVRDFDLPDFMLGLLNGGTKIEYLLVNGKAVDLNKGEEANLNGTNLFVNLPDPLAAGGKLNVEIAWKNKLTPHVGRYGFTDSTTCFVGYWYPKIAVYDDINGWDTHSFRGMTEFYSDLADYDVSVEIPADFAVWGTGILQNPKEVLPTEILKRYDAAATATQTVTIIGNEDWNKGLKMNGGKWRFKASDVPDFAIVFSDHYVWESISLPLDNRQVRISSLYHPVSSESCKKVTALQRDVMKFFSEKSPGIPYPYPAFTSFFQIEPGGGMEFPMFANNGCPSQETWMTGLVAHEMHHTYFPFYVRTNERQYAWMDEGWADFMAGRAVSTLMNTPYTLKQHIEQKTDLESSLGTLDNLPLLTSTDYLSLSNYYYTSYNQPNFIYDELAEMLGEETFLKCMRGYMNRWKYKSPTPYDFFFSFNDLSGKDLNWFWKAWFMEFGYPDLSIGKVTPGKITVHRKGSKPVPVYLTIIFAPGDTLRVRKSAAVWENGGSDLTVNIDKKLQPRQVFLNDILPDHDNTDNFFQANPALSEVQLKAYAGKFHFGENGGTITITPNAKCLVATTEQPNNQFVLLPMGGDKFGTMDGTFNLTFERDGKGLVKSYKGNRFENEVKGERI